MKPETTHITKGKPIGGWLWLIGMWLILGLLVNVVSKTFTITEVLPTYDQFVSANRELKNELTIAISSYVFTIIGNAVIVVWALYAFFKRKTYFIYLFLSEIVFSVFLKISFLFLTDEINRQLILEISLDVVKFLAIGVIGGLYLYKGSRPKQTFVNS